MKPLKSNIENKRNIIKFRTILLITIFIISCFFITILNFSLYFTNFIQTRYHYNMKSIAGLGAIHTSDIFADFLYLDLMDDNYVEISCDDLRQHFSIDPSLISNEYCNTISSGPLTRYSTLYDSDPDLTYKIRQLNQSFLSLSNNIVSAHPVDRNGYVPWHGSAFEKLTGVKDYDLMHFREKRKWTSSVDNGKSTLNNPPYYHKIESGETLLIVGHPIILQNQLWGYYIITYSDNLFVNVKKDIIIKFVINIIIIVLLSYMVISYILRKKLFI